MTGFCPVCHCAVALALAAGITRLERTAPSPGYRPWVTGLVITAAGQLMEVLQQSRALDLTGWFGSVPAIFEAAAVAAFVLGVEAFHRQDVVSRRGVVTTFAMLVVLIATALAFPGETFLVLQALTLTGLFFGGSILLLFAFPQLPGRHLTLAGFALGGLAALASVIAALLVDPSSQGVIGWLERLEPLATAGSGVGFIVLLANRSLLDLQTAAAALEKTQEHLLELAEVDPLTQCANRHALRAWFENWDEHHVVSVVLVDVDDLKGINDRHGHAAGDEALKLVARVLTSTTRSDDLVVRWGGDEFLVVLSGAGQVTAMRRFGDLIRLLTESASDFPYDEDLRVSWGVSSCATREGITAALEQADQHMDANKARRRASRR